MVHTLTLSLSSTAKAKETSTVSGEASDLNKYGMNVIERALAADVNRPVNWHEHL